jgi:hypothetical protein
MAQALSYSADIHSARMRALTYLLSLKRSTLRAVTAVATMDFRATDLLNILFYSCCQEFLFNAIAWLSCCGGNRNFQKPFYGISVFWWREMYCRCPVKIGSNCWVCSTLLVVGYFTMLFLAEKSNEVGQWSWMLDEELIGEGSGYLERFFRSLRSTKQPKSRYWVQKVQESRRDWKGWKGQRMIYESWKWQRANEGEEWT